MILVDNFYYKLEKVWKTFSVNPTLNAFLALPFFSFFPSLWSGNDPFVN